jgi:hypothetical protein
MHSGTKHVVIVTLSLHYLDVLISSLIGDP